MVHADAATVAGMDYKDRLAEAMREAGVEARQLANALGVSYQAIKKLQDGGSNALSAENNSKAAAFLGVNTDWLATGNGPKQRTTPKGPTWEEVCRSSVDLIDSPKAREVVTLFIAAVDARMSVIIGAPIRLNTGSDAAKEKQQEIDQ